MEQEEGKGWAVTIRFSRKHEGQEQERMVKGLFREIMNEEHIELAYAGAYITHPAPHAHFIVFGASKQGQSLKQIDKSKWKRRWEARSGLNIQALDIKDIPDEEKKQGWKGYIQKNVRSDEESRQVFYNNKMLHRIGEA